MARHGGFQGGMPGNMQNVLRQAQRMQKQHEEKLKELEASEFEGSAGGGAVTVKMSGKKILTSVAISKEAIDPDDAETLQDMIIAAVNDAATKVSEEEDKLNISLGGLGLPF